MFVSAHHVPNLLDASVYVSESQLAEEQARLFMPAWHCVGHTDEFPHEGSYRTLNLFSHPLLVCRFGDQLHCYLNICSHRFCTLTDKPCGQFDKRLKCQYHGWEFDETGNTRKIPDAGNFKPLKPGVLGLTKFRCETAGSLVWITFDDDAPSLAAYLGPLYSRCEDWFGPQSRLVITEDDFGSHAEHRCNWKVIIENVLESYHVEMVHPKTFKTASPESQSSHSFYENWDHLEVDYSEDGNFLQGLVSRMIGVKPDYTWHHLCRYPNVVFGQLAWFHFVQAAVPLTPTTTRFFTRVVVDPGKVGSLRARLMLIGLRRWAKKWFPTVNREDAQVFPGVQIGLASPRRPRGGLVSRREERIFAFQKYIQAQTNCEVPTEPALFADRDAG